ncbi:MAG: ABC transporter permease subunit [Desulfurococcales archaeon]|nr:ABC transporter permease subunit [Desulfurococcales archaeon]
MFNIFFSYTDLFIALLYSMMRMFIAYMISVILGLIIGVSMARNRYVEAILLPVLDVLQSIPILGFFPVAILILIKMLPGWLGIETAVIFLLITSLLWNIIFGVYSSLKALDPSINDLVKVYRIGFFTRFFRIYSVASARSIAANSVISWAGGWFFLTSAEVLTLGGGEYEVKGIGAELIKSFASGDYNRFVAGLITLILGIMFTYVFIWNPMASESVNRRLVSIDFIYKRFIKPLARSLWNLIAIVLERLELYTRSLFNNFLKRHMSRIYVSKKVAIKITFIIIVITTIISLNMSLIKFESFTIKPAGTDMSRFLLNTLLSLSRVSGVVFIGILLSIMLTYISYRSSYKDGGIIFMLIILLGELLASMPAVFWWPILYSIAYSGIAGSYIVSLIVFLQGSMWYSYFNILIFGLSSVRRDLMELADIYKIKGSIFLRKIFIPAMIPSIAAGGLSAWGGAWNSTIVAEYIDLGGRKIDLDGLGALLNIYASENRFTDLMITLLYMILIIILINKLVWREVFKRVSRRFMVD